MVNTYTPVGNQGRPQVLGKTQLACKCSLYLPCHAVKHCICVYLLPCIPALVSVMAPREAMRVKRAFKLWPSSWGWGRPRWCHSSPANTQIMYRMYRAMAQPTKA